LTEEVNVETECKNCNHAISMHQPKCTAAYHDFIDGRICGCENPNYYGALVSDEYMGWTEFHCNNCGNLIGFLNSIDENIYEIIEDEAILCPNCITIKKSEQ
jgi:DNA-directed RNA polymerase subunit RPC12/RpoP